jgi:hypothetical protein
MSVIAHAPAVFCYTLALAHVCGFGSEMDKGTVHVVPTLHQYHAAAPGYGFEALTKVLEHLRPHVLVVELTDSALRSKRAQPVKREYQKSIFPYAERHAVPMVAMEPGEPLFDEFATRSFEAEQQFRERCPARYAEYERSVIDFFQDLLQSCDGPHAFNSERTDRLFEDKHARENELFGADYRERWNRWNEHFAQTIVATAQGYPGRRIAALAGLEHGYWLRRRLAELAPADGAWSLAPRLSP